MDIVGTLMQMEANIKNIEQQQKMMSFMLQQIIEQQQGLISSISGPPENVPVRLSKHLTIDDLEWLKRKEAQLAFPKPAFPDYTI